MNMEEMLLQIAMAVIGSLGFAIFFNTRGKKLALIAVGSALSTLVYLLVMYRTQDRVVSTLAGALVSAAIAEIMARMMKTPVIILLVPIVIPLVPGGDLYYSMRYFIMGNAEEFSTSFQFMLKEAAAIAGGMILVSFIVQLILKSKRYFKEIRHDEI